MDNNDEYKEPHFSRILSDGVLLFLGRCLSDNKLNVGGDIGK